MGDLREAEKLRPFRRRGTLEAFSESYQHTDTGRLDQRYYELADMGPQRVRYIRGHPDEFVF